MRVGLTGGIGVGKSAVATLFEEFGAFVIDTDRSPARWSPAGPTVCSKSHDAWPQVVRDGALDRAALAEIVFPDPAARERLDAIVHPRVRLLARAARSGRRSRAKWWCTSSRCSSKPDTRDSSTNRCSSSRPKPPAIARVVARDGLDESQMRARMRAQIAPERARALADFVIENDGGLDELRARARAVYDRLARP